MKNRSTFPFVLLLMASIVVSTGCSTSKTVEAPGRVNVSNDWYPRRPDGTENEGAAEVRVCIAPNGSVENATLVSSSGHEDLDATAVALMKAGRYKAETKDGHPIGGCKIFRVTYGAGQRKVASSN